MDVLPLKHCGKEFTRAIKVYGMRASMKPQGRLHGMKFTTRRAAMDEIVD